MSIEHTPRNFPFDKADLDKAVETLREGGIIVYPTDTIWGLGCDATNKEAVERIYKIKQRCDSKALILLADTDAMISNHIVNAPEVAWSIVELSDKPTTVIFEKGKNLAPNVLAADGSVAFRLTREEFSSQLCHRLHRPVVSTSANISGQPSPRCFGEISQEVINSADYVVAYRQDDATPASPSTIIKINNNSEVKIIRQ
ncbi:MAG: L-threonylcarbamoyladenylate synthase [Bacteroidaceae bacterium]